MEGQQGGDDRASEHAGEDQVGVGRRQDVAEEQGLDPRRRGRREGEQGAESEECSDDDGDGGIAADPRRAPDEGNRDRGDRDAGDAADQQRDSGQGGQNQAGKEGMSERLRGVGDAIEDHPAAERPARDRDQPDLEQGPAHELLTERVCQPADHQWWWAGRTPSLSLPGISTIAPA